MDGARQKDVRCMIEEVRSCLGFDQALLLFQGCSLCLFSLPLAHTGTQDLDFLHHLNLANLCSMGNTRRNPRISGI